MSQFLKWAAEMDRAASVAEAESDGSPQFLAIIDGNRAIAEALRQGAALEARLESIEHVSRRRGDDLNRIRAMCTPAAQEPDIESTPDCVRRNLATARADLAATKAKLAALAKSATDLREVAFDGPSEPKGNCCSETLWQWKQRIDRESAAAIAAARGGDS